MIVVCFSSASKHITTSESSESSNAVENVMWITEASIVFLLHFKRNWKERCVKTCFKQLQLRWPAELQLINSSVSPTEL